MKFLIAILAFVPSVVFAAQCAPSQSVQFNCSSMPGASIAQNYPTDLMICGDGNSMSLAMDIKGQAPVEEDVAEQDNAQTKTASFSSTDANSYAVQIAATSSGLFAYVTQAGSNLGIFACKTTRANPVVP